MIIRIKAIEEAVKFLQASGAKFHVVYEDKVYGEPVYKKIARKLKYPMGTIRKYIKPSLEHIAPGGSAIIDAGQFDLELIQSNVGSWCSANWGKKKFMTAQNKENRTVEVLRIE